VTVADGNATPEPVGPRIVASGGAVAWGKNYDPPQGAYSVWQETPDGPLVVYPYPPRKQP
jgi:hypothetical protein